ncbi:MAG: hypothetical protein DVB23_001218 [Verrucomicrobia bacterium]|jgi:hypothetical protein|nr:MAG: hypothetical protein DVB23_001218 [Verrucomicrobiota bacterium]
MEKYLGEDSLLLLLAAMFVLFMAVRAWHHGALEMLWTLLSWSVGGAVSALAFRHGPNLLITHGGIALDEGQRMVASVIFAVAAFAIARGLIVWAIRRAFGPESKLGGWMYGGTGSIISVLPSLAFLVLLSLLIRGTGTMFELESVDRMSAAGSPEDRAKYAALPGPTRWRNGLEGLPNVAVILDTVDPLATPARRNLAALVLASYHEGLRSQLRRSPITATVAKHPITVELTEHSPDLASLVAGTDGEFKYYRLLRHPKLNLALADAELRNSLEQVDVADEIRALVSGRSMPPRKKWLEKIFS